MNEAIGGTIIQRSYVGVETGNVIHIATAPLKELAFDEDKFIESVAELVGTPVDFLLASDNYESMLQDMLLRGSPPPPISSQLAEIDKTLFSDFLLLVSSPSSVRVQPSLVHYEHDGRRISVRPPIDEKEVVAWDCVSARFWRSEQSRCRAQRFQAELLDYDVPLGQSPKVESECPSKNFLSHRNRL